MANKRISKNTFGLWWFNPGFAFGQIQNLGARWIILTSGTLSPMKPFSYELQTKFPLELESPHVINPNQVMIGSLSNGK